MQLYCQDTNNLFEYNYCNNIPRDDNSNHELSHALNNNIFIIVLVYRMQIHLNGDGQLVIQAQMPLECWTVSSLSNVHCNLEWKEKKRKKAKNQIMAHKLD